MSLQEKHIEGFDLLRAVSIFAVVWIHGCDTNPLALRWSVYAAFAVPCFVLMSFFLLQLSMMRAPEKKAGEIIVRRLKRLVPAYLAWTAVYVLVRTLKHAFLHSNDEAWDWISILFFGGASYQLYFIALLIYWSLLFVPLMKWTGRGSAHAAPKAGLMLLFGCILFWLGPAIREGYDIEPGYSLLRHAAGLTGYIPLGIAAALLWRRRGRAFSAGRVSWLFIAVAVAIVVVHPGYTRALSAALFLAALFLTGVRKDGWIGGVSRLSYGIFMAHGLFVEGLQTAAGVFGLPLGSMAFTVGVIVASFIASYLLCLLLERVRPLTWLVR